MNIGYVIGDLCIGFYTLFLIIQTISEIKAYIGDVYGANTELDKKITLDKIIFLLIMIAISFCPIFNILLCLLFVCVRWEKKVVYEEIKENYLNKKENLGKWRS